MAEFINVGGLWKTKSGEGLSGKLTQDVPQGAKVLIQKNKRKQPGEKFPDYYVTRIVEDGEGSQEPQQDESFEF